MPKRLSRKMVLLALVGMGGTIVVGFVVVVLLISWFSSPPFGLGNAPPQPIAFPHTVHAGQPPEGIGIQCEFCHRNVTKGESATVPALEQCMFCHAQVVGTTEKAKAEIAKLVQAYGGADPETGQPINWERVHRVPDHVRFVHEAHIRFFTQPGTVKHLLDGGVTTTQLTVEQTCSICHGEVAKMTELKPKRFQSMKMGTCLDCHRENNVPTDCTICHK